MEPTQGNDVRAVQPLGASSSPHAETGQFADADELRDALEDVFESVEALLQRANGFLSQYAEEKPQLLIAGAAGLGFVLGGGLASRTGSLLVRSGGRMLLAQWLQHLTRERAEGKRSRPSAKKTSSTSK